VYCLVDSNVAFVVVGEYFAWRNPEEEECRIVDEH